jgi:excisionase family DNA binding protein
VTDDVAARVTKQPGEWLSLGPASRQLGVDPDTLRRWADVGLVRAYATPGGHRRFRRADLDRVQQSRRDRRRPLAALGATPDRLARAYARAYRSDTRSALASRLGDHDREVLRDAGRQLVEQMRVFLDTSSGAEKATIEATARSAVALTGQRLARSGVTVSAAVEAFVAARAPFLGELEALGRRRSLNGRESTALYAEAASLFDRLLIHFVRSFQRALEV